MKYPINKIHKRSLISTASTTATLFSCSNPLYLTTTKYRNRFGISLDRFIKYTSITNSKTIYFQKESLYVNARFEFLLNPINITPFSATIGYQAPQ